jgi:hypothetical protein
MRADSIRARGAGNGHSQRCRIYGCNNAFSDTMGSSCIAGRTIYGLTACRMRFAYRLRSFATTAASPLRRHARAHAYRGPLGLAPLSLPRGKDLNGAGCNRH